MRPSLVQVRRLSISLGTDKNCDQLATRTQLNAVTSFISVDKRFNNCRTITTVPLDYRIVRGRREETPHYPVQLIICLIIIRSRSQIFNDSRMLSISSWNRRLGVIRNANEFWVSSQFVNRMYDCRQTTVRHYANVVPSCCQKSKGAKYNKNI